MILNDAVFYNDIICIYIQFQLSNTIFGKYILRIFQAHILKFGEIKSLIINIRSTFNICC